MIRANGDVCGVPGPDTRLAVLLLALWAYLAWRWVLERSWKIRCLVLIFLAGSPPPRKPHTLCSTPDLREWRTRCRLAVWSLVSSRPFVSAWKEPGRESMGLWGGNHTRDRGALPACIHSLHGPHFKAFEWTLSKLYSIICLSPFGLQFGRVHAHYCTL